MCKKVVLLINIGTPDSPEVKDVRTYLHRFLNDGRVMTMPSLFRRILVDGIIVPFRASKSSKAYQSIWTEQGSPFSIYFNQFQKKLQNVLGEEYLVENAMLYSKPLLTEVLERYKDSVQELIVFPLYPQYASSTTGAALETVFKMLSTWTNIPNVKTLPAFFDQKGYIESVSTTIENVDLQSFDHLLFSFHGLPLSHILESHGGGEACQNGEVLSSESHQTYKHCYQAQCYETVQAVVENVREKLSIPYSVSFQSRLSKDWMQPFTDHTLIELAKQGKKRVAVACPSFVVDCLETLYEIEKEYAELFQEHGGEELKLIPSLNDNDNWVHAAAGLIRNK